MTQSRLTQLLKFYEEDPNDPFNLYAVALEYAKSDRIKAEELFDRLVREQPEYLPVYYQAALLKQELGKTDDALILLQKGMELAKRKNEPKTLRELQGTFDDLFDK